jgi:CheY-like chemotaxis protein
MPAHILIADDDPTNRMVLHQALSALGHRTSLAADGPTALEILAFEAVDLALLDLHMPRQSGLDVLRELRQFEGPNRFIPAICVTADVLSRRPDEYLDLGFQDFLAKPVQLGKLAVAVDKALLHSVEKLRREGVASKLAALRKRFEGLD